MSITQSVEQWTEESKDRHGSLVQIRLDGSYVLDSRLLLSIISLQNNDYNQKSIEIKNEIINETIFLRRNTMNFLVTLSFGLMQLWPYLVVAYIVDISYPSKG